MTTPLKHSRGPKGGILVALSLITFFPAHSKHASGVVLADEILPSLAISDASLKKGDTGTAQAFFTVTLSSPSKQTVTVQYATADGTAIAGTDYVRTSGTLTFEPRTTQERILVLVIGRNITQSDRTFFVNLSNPTNATIAKSQGVGTLLADSLAIILQFSKSNFSAKENAGSAIITVTRTGSSAGSASVQYATSDGTAAVGLDYVTTSGTLTFASGETSQTFSITIVDDSLVEENETVFLSLSNPAGGATLGTPNTAVLHILDAEIAQAGNLQFTTVGPEVSEGAGSAIITVVRRNGIEGSVSVNYATSDGAATAASDYVATSGILAFAPGETTRTFSITIIDDDLAENDETVIVSLHNPTGGATLGIPSMAVLKIVDNDKAAPIVTGITPRYGDPGGGTFVRVSGQSFNPDAIVLFGDAPARSIQVIQNTVIVCVSPPGTGTVDVAVTTAVGTGKLTAAFAYLAVAPQGIRLEWFAPEFGVNPTSFTGDMLPPPRHLKATRVRGASPAPQAESLTSDSPLAPSGPLHLLSYNVYRSSDPTFVVSDPSAQLIVNIPAGTASYFDPDVDIPAIGTALKGPTSFYRVTAVYEQGASLWTNIASHRVAVTGVSLENISGTLTLVVEGVSFATFRSRIQVDGVTVKQTTYPKSARVGNGTSTRIEGIDAFSSLIPIGKTVSIMVINPGTEEDLSDAEFSTPFSLTRTK